MAELLIFAASALVVGAGLWLLHRGRGGPLPDEPQRLDVQNHVDDP